MRFLKAYKLPVFKLLALGFLISFCSGLYAQNLPERPNPPRLVNDFANILTKEQAQKLEDKLVAFDDSTSNQIAIVTMSDLNGVPASAMAPELFIKWGIGHTGRDNGILVLVSMSNPREVFINTGYGVESYVTDAMAGRIVQEHLIPRFKENDYFGGLDLATNDLMQLLQGSFKGFGKKKEKAPFPPIIFVILIIIVVIIISRNSKGGGGRYMRTFGGPFPGSYGGYGRSGGFGGFGGGSSGGGFGGFGGGSTGGGGAGGSW